jgi:hypothetical protein
MVAEYFCLGFFLHQTAPSTDTFETPWINFYFFLVLTELFELEWKADSLMNSYVFTLVLNIRSRPSFSTPDFKIYCIRLLKN